MDYLPTNEDSLSNNIDYLPTNKYSQNNTKNKYIITITKKILVCFFISKIVILNNKYKAFLNVVVNHKIKNIIL